MAHEVFISHSSKDKLIADAMCNKLESNGIRCWMAPRDIWPGRKWSEAIVQAIGESRLMVLIFSTNANTSDNIERELEIAANKRLPILPFRVDDVQPSGVLEYYLGTPHWLDALTPPLEQHLTQLVVSVKQLLQIPSLRPAPVPQTPLAQPADQTSPAPTVTEKPVPTVTQTPHAAPARETVIRAAGDFPRVLTNQVGIEMVYVPAGSFMMGSEKGSLMDLFMGDTKPVHQVTISQGFYMGKYQVTQAQWQQVMGKNPSHFKGEHLPVEQVTWKLATGFIERLNALNDGYAYQLPSETRWEYACRAGTTGEYAGDLDAMAWYSKNSGNKTHPVGTNYRTHSGCLICMAIFGSGVRIGIATAIAITGRRRMRARGLSGMVPISHYSGPYAADRGTTGPISAAPPTASGTIPTGAS
ncbi:MAG: hypothetical protein JWM21_4684 [Acidobacteria bacterium]|nr:hypothetical protein [Acidobacteriota bacterium]